jgi:hypothetical protein
MCCSCELFPDGIVLLLVPCTRASSAAFSDSENRKRDIKNMSLFDLGIYAYKSRYYQRDFGLYMIGVTVTAPNAPNA